MAQIMTQGASCGDAAKVCDSGYIYIEGQWDWRLIGCGVREKERKAVEEAGFGWGKFRSVILDVHLKYLLHIQVDMSPRQLNIWFWSERMIPEEDINLGVAGVEMVLKVSTLKKITTILHASCHTPPSLVSLTPVLPLQIWGHTVW